MAKIVVQTDHAPKSFAGYSQAVKAGGLVFVSGQGPFDPTGALVGDTIQEQTAQCFRNIEAILKAAGSSLERAVSATFILGEESDFAGMNEEWNKWFRGRSAGPSGRKAADPAQGDEDLDRGDCRGLRHAGRIFCAAPAATSAENAPCQSVMRMWPGWLATRASQARMPG